MAIFEQFLTCRGGAMGCQMTQNPPAVVICHIDALDQPFEITAQAFRDIASDVRMLLIAPAQRRVDAQRVVSAGFDHCLFEPIESQRLLWAIADNGGPRALDVKVKQDLADRVQPRRDANPSDRGSDMACDPLNELANQLDLDRPP